MSVQAKKAAPCDYYGCISWQPPVPVGESLQDLEQKQEALKLMTTEMTPDIQILRELMKHTYGLQRRDIIEGQNALELKEIWPFLFTPAGLDVHFIELTGVPLIETIAHRPTAVKYTQLSISSDHLGRNFIQFQQRLNRLRLQCVMIHPRFLAC